MIAVSMYPLVEDPGGLTASKGELCAYAEGDDLAAVMADAGRLAGEWLAAPLESGEDGPEPFAFDVRVQLAAQ